jgi:hypothetical protein
MVPTKGILETVVEQGIAESSELLLEVVAELNAHERYIKYHDVIYEKWQAKTLL